MKLEDLRALTAHFQGVSQTDYGQVKSLLTELGLDPDNLYQELEMSHRFVQVHRDESYSNSILQLHSHTFYEILCCRSDCGAEYLVGTERYRLQKGDIIFVSPGISHRPLLPEQMPKPYTRDVLWISEEFVEVLQNAFTRHEVQPHGHSSLLRTANTKWDYLSGMLREAVQESERKSADWEIAVTGSAMTFMSHLKRAFLDRSTTAIAAEKPDLLGEIMAYMEENLAEKITLAGMARHFYVSESTIHQTFQKKMGTGFHRCLTQRRLITAKQLIEEGCLLEQVALRTGFSDYSAFYRAFRQEYGISPRQYRSMREMKKYGPQ